MIDASSVLRAGGVAPLGAKIEGDLRAGPVSARAFTHQALPGETIVRLVPDVLAPGVDVEMDTLGFARSQADDRPALGLQKFRALGFPGWPLVHDPARAKFALEVMKAFKKAVAQAKSKPGNARDDLVEIGNRLARSVPHFLPSFWEEAGRAFLAEDSTTFAAQSFEKARLAEKEHNLAIDEDARSAVYLEFALAGAVAAKSLAGYARELAEAYGPAAAWPRYRELAVRRVLGGMPPWSGMAKELRALCKAARLDVDAEDRAFIAELLEAPALVRAPAELWTSYRAALVALAAERPAMRKRLRHLFPKPSAGAKDFPLLWLELLGEAGALAGLSSATGEDSEESGGAAEWFNKALSFVDGAKELLPVLRDLAPRLIADQRPVQLAFGSAWRSRVELDVTELAFELGVPVADPPENASIDLARPFACDPVAVAGHERFQPLMLAAVESVLGAAPFEAAARGKEGLRVARGAWVRREVARLSKTGLPAVAHGLERLIEKATAALWTDFPDALEALRAIDVADALARSLQIGVFAELTWPAWESLARTIGAEFTVGGAWPYPVLHTNAKAWVLGPEGVVLEHDFVLPPKGQPQRVVYLDGDLLVSFWSPDGAQAYWASASSEPFATDGYLHWYGDDLPLSCALPDGGVTLGGAAIHRGDRKVGSFAHFVTDGEHFWTSATDDGRWRLRELDPQTGALGRFSWPRFVDAAAALDDGLHVLGVTLFPALTAAQHSPLGCRDGLLGHYTRGPDHWQAGRFEWVGVDGRRIEGSRGRSGLPAALVRFPGDERPRVVSLVSDWRAGGGRTYRAHVRDGEVAGCEVSPTAYGGVGWPVIPPLSLWHFCRPRDERGSAALRAIDAATARVLLQAALADRGGAETRKTLPATRAAIARELPAIAAKELADAVAAAALEAAERTARVAEVIAASAGKVDVVQDRVRDQDVTEALGLLSQAGWSQGVLSEEISAVSQAMRDTPPSTFGASMHAWPSWVGALRGLAVWASLAGRQPDEVAVLSRVLAAFVPTIFAEPGKRFRRFDVVIAADSPIRSQTANVWCARHGDSRYFFRTSQKDGAWHGVALEYAHDGELRVPPGVTVANESTFETADDAGWLARFLDAAKAPVPFDPAAVEQLAALTGLTRPEAALLLAGLPRVGRYESDFLGKELRERLGLKAADAKVARETLKSLDRAKLLRALSAAAPDDPRDLFRPYGETDFVARLGRAWNAEFGARRALREELVLACEKDLDPPLAAAALFGALLEPSASPQLRIAKVPFDSLFLFDGRPQEFFGATAAASFAMLLPWAFQALPVSDPYRDALPALHQAVLATLEHPDLLLPLKYFYVEESRKDAARKLIESIGGDETPISLGHQQSEVARDGGGLVGVILGNGFQGRIAFRPGRIGDDRRAYQIGGDANLSSHGYAAIEAVGLLRSAGLASMMARVKQTPVPSGAYEANPALSHPALVAEVSASLGLSAEAATHYLQLLALAEPTSKWVQTWNDWKPPVYKKTCAELLAKRLVVEGKRERAGREVFLPGAWEKAAKGKNLPLEAWKKPLYAPEHGALPRNVLVRPHHEQFEAAWKRVRGGDVPKFEEV